MADKLQFYIIDSTYRIVGETPEVRLFGKTADNKQLCIIDKNFRPYFYVFLKDEDDSEEFIKKIQKISIEQENRNAKVISAEQAEKNYLGKKHRVVRVFTNLPADIPVIKEVIKEWDMIKSINEYDIPFTRRYFIEKGITPLVAVEAEGKFVNAKSRVPCFEADSIAPASDESLEDPDILAFDIETYNPDGKGFNPDKNPILMIALHGKDYNKVITWKKFDTSHDHIEFAEGEAGLISRFKEIIERKKPDIITGYFSDRFDLPYIIKRAKKYSIDLDIGLDFSNPVISRGKKESVSINGISHVDVYGFILKTIGRSMDTETYKLNDVAKELLGEEKDDVDIDGLSGAWDKHDHALLEDFCRYNLKDAVLTYRLCKKIIPQIFELVKIVGLPIKEVSSMSSSQLVEWYILRQVQEFDEIAPNRPSHHEINGRTGKKYEGAFVYEPTPGLYKNIAVFDFRSLYPTIIASHNICLSTLRHSPGPKREKVPLDEEYYFSNSRKGFLPSIIEDLITRRMRIKEILKSRKDAFLEARSSSLKLLANSFYGYLGFYAARWYSWECASSVTAFGRYHISKVIEEAEKDGFGVIYGDTDSIFLDLKEKTRKDAFRFGEKINEKLPGLMELEYEGDFPAGIFVSSKEGSAGAKKRYALMDEKGNLKIKGFETIRRNWSFIGKEVQEKVLKIILKENDLDKAVRYAKEIIEELKEKKISNEKVVIFTQLQKPIEEYAAIGPHVAVARRLISQGKDVKPGTIIKFIITSGKGVLRDRARTPEETPQGDYDADYYINNQIIPSVDKIFEALGYRKEDLTEDKKQTGLGDFF